MSNITVSQALQGRRSIRYFNDRPVDKSIIENIIRDAQWAPSWANAQPWQAYVATGKTLAAIKAAHLDFIRNRVPSRPELATEHRENWGTKAQRNMGEWWQDLQRSLTPDHAHEFGESQTELFNAPALVYLTAHRDSPLWALYDVGAFGQSLMLSAYAQGVDSMPAYELVKYPQYVRELMGIPDNERLIMGIALGYRAEEKINEFRSQREPLKNVLVLKE
ncbi:nitroreductase [Pasteurellaceae bacterium LIM206]|nr:nitroreductase [Pasteurellaceae bacterium LIM206]